MTTIPIGFAFVAGLVSFLAPCILPIIPGFLAYLAGAGLNEPDKRREIFFNSVFFVLGFSVVFAVLGILLNTVLGAAAYEVRTWLSRIGGTLIIFFGLYLMGLVRIGFLEREHAFTVRTRMKSRYLTSIVFGAAFAAGWTPCVGAALGSILALAATQPGSSFVLLMAYSLGLGVPFLAVGLFAAEAQSIIERYAGFVRYLNVAFGALLVLLGILVFTEELNRLASFELLNRLLLQ